MKPLYKIQQLMYLPLAGSTIRPKLYLLNRFFVILMHDNSWKNASRLKITPHSRSIEVYGIGIEVYGIGIEVYGIGIDIQHWHKCI